VKRLLAIVFVLALLAMAVLAIQRRTPGGQLPLGDVEAFRAAFEAAPGPKLLLLLSPTCPTCLQTAQDVQRALQDNGQASVRVFALWTNVLRWDRLGPTQKALGRLHDGRVSQYSDPGNRAAEALCASTPALGAMCSQSSTLYGGVLYFEPGARWGDSPSWAGFDELPPQFNKMTR